MRCLSFFFVLTLSSLVLVSPGAGADLVAGDVDRSGGVNAVDIQLVINAALDLPVPVDTDVDYSGDTNAVDVQLVINAALDLDIDTDTDGLCDGAETNLGTNKDLWDTDGDSVGDGQEMLDGTNPLDPEDYLQTDMKMVFEPDGFEYYAQGQTTELELFTRKVSIRPARGSRGALESWLENDPLVKQPLEIDDLSGDGILLVTLVDGATEADILEFLSRLDQTGLTRYSSPMFVAPSTRIIVTDEFIVKFKDSYSVAEIEAYINDQRARILRRDFLWPRCYILGFAASGGANTLEVAQRFYESEMVEYAHPNFITQTEPPEGNSPQLEREMLQCELYPNLFMEFEHIQQLHTLASGWVTLAEEDFEGEFPKEGWMNYDDNTSNGEYYWGVVDDAQYPNITRADYVAQGFKGWVAGSHDAASPDRQPDQGGSESYAANMDSWLVCGPFDFSNAYWARFWFKFFIWAPATETLEWLASVDQVNWYGHSQSGVGNEGYLVSVWPRSWRNDHPNKSLKFDLTNVPELGDLTGHDQVWVALRFQSNNALSPLPYAGMPFYGAYIDDVRLEVSNTLSASAISTDPLSDAQWGLYNVGQSGGDYGIDINVRDAWDYIENTPEALPIDDGIIVAVIDEGVDLDHEDLNLVPGYDATYVPGAPIQPNGVGQDSQGGPLPWDAHGTACAGVIGAKRNGNGTVGVAPGVKIMPVRIAYSPEAGGNWRTTAAEEADGIIWAAQNGAKVLSNSWGGYSDWDIRHNAVIDAKAMGCTVVCATGNDNRSQVGFPARYDEVIAVGAISPTGERKNPDSSDGEWFWGSNYGPNLDVMAPGVLIATADIMGEDGYRIGNYNKTFNGTSSACPHVAGVAALMLTINPGLSPDDVQAIIQDTAVDLADPGWDEETGWGLVDADAAARQTPLPEDLAVSQWSPDSSASPGQTIGGSFTIENLATVQTGPFQVQGFLSSDTVVDGDDEILYNSTYWIDPLDTLEEAVDLTIPGDAIPGFYYLILWVDAENEIAEVDETDNLAIQSFQVTQPPDIVLKPSSIDFGEIQVGSGSSKNVYIKNEGYGTLQITAIAYTGDPEITVEYAPPPFAIAPWGYRLMGVVFLPQDAGEYSGTVTVSSNDPDEPELQVPIVGTAVAEVPVLWAFPSLLIFGHALTERSFTIANDGEGTLSWSITDDLPGWLDASPMGGDTLPDAPIAVTATVGRSGLSPGVYTHSLSISSNGSDSSVLVAMTVGAESPGWAKAYIGPEWDYAHNHDLIQPTRDGGYIIAANTESYGASVGDYMEDIWLLKVDGAGDVEWQKTYGGPSIDVAECVRQTSDNGYVVVGYTYSFSYTESKADMWILKLDNSGGIDWEKTYGGGYGEQAESIQQTGDGGYIVAGQTGSFGQQGSCGFITCRDIWLMKLDSAGEVQWERTYGGPNGDYAQSVQQTADGGYIVAGNTTSFGVGNTDVWVLKVGRSGAVEWEKTYGGESNDSSRSIHQTADGGYILGGQTDSFGAGKADYWVVKLAGDGTAEWEKAYGGAENDYAAALELTADGGYILAGWTYSFAVDPEDLYGQDGWILKLNSGGGIDWQKVYNHNADWLYAIHQAHDGGYIALGETNWSEETDGDLWVLKLTYDGTLGCGIEAESEASVTTTDAYVVSAEEAVAASSAFAGTSNATVTDSSATVEVLCDGGGTS